MCFHLTQYFVFFSKIILWPNDQLLIMWSWPSLTQGYCEIAWSTMQQIQDFLLILIKFLFFFFFLIYVIIRAIWIYHVSPLTYAKFFSTFWHVYWIGYAVKFIIWSKNPKSLLKRAQNLIVTLVQIEAEKKLRCGAEEVRRPQNKKHAKIITNRFDRGPMIA